MTSEATRQTEQTDEPFVLDRTTPAFYRRLGPDLYAPTIHTQGAWRDDEQHMAPVSGVIAHAIDRH